jgi:hypothetical protein
VTRPGYEAPARSADHGGNRCGPEEGNIAGEGLLREAWHIFTETDERQVPPHRQNHV